MTSYFIYFSIANCHGILTQYISLQPYICTCFIMLFTITISILFDLKNHIGWQFIRVEGKNVSLKKNKQTQLKSENVWKLQMFKNNIQNSKILSSKYKTSVTSRTFYMHLWNSKGHWSNSMDVIIICVPIHRSGSELYILIMP